jgi:hypothetical protein
MPDPWHRVCIRPMTRFDQPRHAFASGGEAFQVGNPPLPGYLAGSGLDWDACAWTTPPLCRLFLTAPPAVNS